MLRRDTAAGVILAIEIKALLFQVALAGATRVAGQSLGGGSYVSLVAAAIMVAGAVLTFRALPASNLKLREPTSGREDRAKDK